VQFPVAIIYPLGLGANNYVVRKQPTVVAQRGTMDATQYRVEVGNTDLLCLVLLFSFAR
jgi:hypothetical protein